MKPIVFFICCCLVASVHAQDRIDTDRPDQTESAVLVPKRYFQGEFGFNKENSGNRYFRIVHPTFLLKYGLSKRFELRLESAYATEYAHLIPNTVTTTDLAPVEIGTKIALFEEKGWRPKTSLIFHIGSSFETSHPVGEWDFLSSLRFTCQSTITETIGLGYNIGFESDGVETDLLYTIAPNINLGKRWYAYVELFGFKRRDPYDFQKHWLHSLDTGLAYYISKDTKLDLSAGLGLGINAMNDYIALGFSFRFH